ncbi:ABC transporter substrate-binding protein [Marinococcus halophilus]|uniref:Putative ABC transporter substrate-binding lipoprotein YvrC n=1 Tax=Marinococcus halophilus TaxID=1371 RepID=A0A510Y3M6_MARHA|nr:ABC transporter substrate-binding protein [Marinococcus halophilus]GEK57936.1 putative ABC transporter substrate-binding lipoprotein YvrC [Marinococcus halophilus]
MKIKALMIIPAAGTLAACSTDGESGNDGSSNENTEAIEVTDASGETITLDEAPDEIVSLMPSNTEIVYELGALNKIEARTDADTYPEEVTDIESVGSGLEPNIEEIIAMDPDMVLAHASSGIEDSLSQVEEAGIPVITVPDAQSFDAVYDSIELIGTAIGEEEEAKEVIGEMKKDVSDVKKATEEAESSQEVYVEVGASPDLYTAGSGTFIDEMLSAVHAENAASELEGWSMVSEEEIIDASPDVILTTYPTEKEPLEMIGSREGWETVPAVENDEVYALSSDKVSRPGPRLTEGLEEMAERIHPDAMAEK